jgi:hypothetical protein
MKPYTDCCYAECTYVEFRIYITMLGVVRLIVIMLSVATPKIVL